MGKRLTPAMVAALRLAADGPHLPPTRLADRHFAPLIRRGLVTVGIVSGAGWQRAGYVLTDAGRDALAREDGPR